MRVSSFFGERRAFPPGGTGETPVTPPYGVWFCDESGAAHTVRIQNIPQRHDSFQLVHISAVHHRQDFDLVCPHALQRQIQPVVGVDVRKNQLIYQLAELLIGMFRQLSLQPRKVDDANHASSIRHQPRSDFTRSHPFQRFPDRDLRRQRLAGGLHDNPLPDAGHIAGASSPSAGGCHPARPALRRWARAAIVRQ